MRDYYVLKAIFLAWILWSLGIYAINIIFDYFGVIIVKGAFFALLVVFYEKFIKRYKQIF